MFYRICRLLTLNIQLIFVFDGPGRPWKRGKRGGGRIDYEQQRLLKEMLQCFGVPYHEAPGEAEAECARLQILGLVDAVWSQDSDCLMFGCTLWLRDHRVAKEKGNTDRSKENTKKNGKYANVVRAHDLIEKHGLDREGVVLFAMLVGGDYDEKGLPQCGPSLAMQAVKQGLGRSLCACQSQADCHFWREELVVFLQRSARGRSINIPSTFPDFKTLQKYHNPNVSSDEDLLNKSRFQLDYGRPIQELKLLKLTSERFNIWGRLYMNWVGPVLLTRSLTTREPSLPLELVHHIKLRKCQAKKTDDEPPMRTFERKLTFSPFSVTTLCRADFEGDRLGHWNGDKESLFDPEHRVDCEFPEYWLHKVLPPHVLDPPPPAPKRAPKRKQPMGDVEEEGEASNTAKRKRKNEKDNIPATRVTHSASPGKSKRPASVVRPRNMPITPTTQKLLDYIELSDSEDEGQYSPPTNTRPREHALNQSKASHIIDLGSPELSDQESNSLIPDPFRGFGANTLPFDVSDEEDEELQLALRLSMQDQDFTINPTQGPSRLPSSNQGKYERIFAMREAGRDIQGSSVPAWSLDQTISAAIPSRAVQTPWRGVENGPSYTSNTPVRGVHAGLIGREPVDVPGWSQQRAAVPSEPTMSLSGSSAKDHVEAIPGPSPADIRAARLRHFAMLSPDPSKKANESRPSPLAVLPKKRPTTTYQVPVGIECIDLTDD
jgi:Holliday junction resolvase YEN1